MYDTFPSPDPQAFDKRMWAQAEVLRAGDKSPATRKEWEERRGKLREAMLAAMGPSPEKPCPLEPREVGVLKREGYRIEKLLFQSRPGVWVTANAYVPEATAAKAPAVLVVHGHWPWARRDPVVQARCLGLVKLGFFVLAVDACGAGERHPTPGKGTYHGVLLGCTLWPAGHTLLGMQVYDNRRAVDYLASRPEVDGERLGITGASGGGNQTMYAGALDERFGAVVPVCSVGTYQAYLQAACCVCEVLPGALRFTEEGDVLGLVAPRALLVINATQDSFQFSVDEAKKSLERAHTVYKLSGKEEKLRHDTFESPHAYNQAMREAMYGWMARWLRNEGEGKPIPEPKHEVEAVEDLACFPDGKRPEGFLFPPSFAAREAGKLLAPFRDKKRDHKEAWEAAALLIRSRLRDEVLGEFPKPPRDLVKTGAPERADGCVTTPLSLGPEPGLTLFATMRTPDARGEKRPACVLLHLDGQDAALKPPLASALVEKGWVVVALEVRGTGKNQPARDAVRDAADHNSAEHGLWVGRPLLGQWVFDVYCLLEWLARQPAVKSEQLVVVGFGQAGLLALVAAGVLDEQVAVAAAVDAVVTLVTGEAYGPGTRMGLLAPGLLRAGDVPHLAALVAPRPLALAGGVTPQGKKVAEKPLSEAYAFTMAVYRHFKQEGRITVREEMPAADLVAFLGRP
jgi:cephalosporin-C deacetylase-like acetyl esterase